MQKLEVNNGSKVLGFGEIMLRLTPTNFQRIIQAESLRQYMLEEKQMLFVA